MRWGIGYPLAAICEAVATFNGWTIVTALTVVLGFSVGYWIGHGQLMSPRMTFEAMLWLPVVWLGRPSVLIAYGTTALAWCLPIYWESERLRWGAWAVNLVAWIVIIAIEVERCSDGKLWRW